MVRLIIGAFIGGLIGFSLGYWGKCASGTCPLTSNPYISTAIGMILGALVAYR